jgi:hypothetical protein
MRNEEGIAEEERERVARGLEERRAPRPEEQDPEGRRNTTAFPAEP